MLVAKRFRFSFPRGEKSALLLINRQRTSEAHFGFLREEILEFLGDSFSVPFARGRF
jgi:hypothetical protein